MIAPAILLIASLAGIAVAFALPGWSDLILVAGPSAIASLLLLLRALPRPGGTPRPWSKHVILDGSNVMHWQGGEPKLATVVAVLGEAMDRGMTPGVVFDANAGHLLFGRYLDDDDFARVLRMPRDRVLVVPKGTPADPTILTAARDLGARIITNDRFRDWAGDFPEVDLPGHLIPGGFRAKRAWLDLG
jgi:hypothetical protein